MLIFYFAIYLVKWLTITGELLYLPLPNCFWSSSTFTFGITPFPMKYVLPSWLSVWFIIARIQSAHIHLKLCLYFKCEMSLLSSGYIISDKRFHSFLLSFELMCLSVFPSSAFLHIFSLCPCLRGLSMCTEIEFLGVVWAFCIRF